MLKNLSRLQNRRTGRFSSWDTSGRNADSWSIPARSSRVLADIPGPVRQPRSMAARPRA